MSNYLLVPIRSSASHQNTYLTPSFRYRMAKSNQTRNPVLYLHFPSQLRTSFLSLSAPLFPNVDYAPFVYPNRGAVPDALIIQQRMKERMGSIVRAKEGYVIRFVTNSSRWPMFCVCVYVSRTVFFFRCPVQIHPLPLTVDIGPLSQPSFFWSRSR